MKNLKDLLPKDGGWEVMLPNLIKCSIISAIIIIILNILTN